MKSHTIASLIGLFLVLALAGLAPARNVDLSTVPKRNTVQLTIYNSEDITLVRETRAVTFKQGANPLQFSWANTLIDPSSVQLRFLTQAEKLEVADTTFPHDKPQMLYWNVQSEFDGQATIEITYFTSGISWASDYILIANKDETRLTFENFVRVYNNSGEEYEDAEVRLVVGTINLVEKIAQLARLPMQEVEKLEENQKLNFRIRAAEKALDMPAINAPAGAAAPAESKPKEIIKEGLSEYFIYSIEGTETIKNGWSKRLRSLEAKEVPFKIQYRYRPDQYGDQLVRMYLLTNDKDSKLGTTPLPDGVVRLFRDNGRDGLSFLTQQSTKYIPIGDKLELNLGPDRNVIFELIKLKTWRDNLWLQVHGTNVFRRVDEPGLQIEVNSSVVGWDEHEFYTQRLRNYTPKAIEVEIRRTWPGHISFRSALNPTLHDYRTPQFTATIQPAQKNDLLFEIHRRQGRNAKQDNVTLENVDVKP